MIDRVRVKAYVLRNIDCLVKVFHGPDTSKEYHMVDLTIVHGNLGEGREGLILEIPDNFPGDVCMGSDWRSELRYSRVPALPRRSLYLNEKQRKVREFHIKNNFTVNDGPTLIDEDLWRARVKILEEEILEYEEAAQEGDIIEIADSLADTLYIVYGTAVAHGLDMTPIFNEVHRSNLTKKPSVGKDGKAVKGINYLSPNLKFILDQPHNEPWYPYLNMNDCPGFSTCNNCTRETCRVVAVAKQRYSFSMKEV